MFSKGTKILLHSYGVGQWFPIEEHEVSKVGRDGTVYIEGLDKVPFKQNGQEKEPGAFRFRFYIEMAKEKKGRKKRVIPKRGRKTNRRVAKKTKAAGLEPSYSHKQRPRS